MPWLVLRDPPHAALVAGAPCHTFIRFGPYLLFLGELLLQVGWKDEEIDER